MKIQINKIYGRSVNVKGRQTKVYDVIGADGQKYTAWEHPIADGWKEGDEIDVNVKEGKPYNGKPQFTIVLPRQAQKPAVDLGSIEAELAQIMKELLEIKSFLKPLLPEGKFVEKEKEDIPF